MPKRNSKGRFTKGGARKARRSHSTAVAHAPRTITRTRTRTVVKRARRRHTKGGIGGIKLMHVVGGGLVLGYLTSDSGPEFIRTTMAKIPGQKTFGTVGVAGAACLAVNHFKPNKWLKLAGLIGIGVAAVGAGAKGTNFKWVGDDDDIGDIGDDDDVSDVGDDDDDVGDYDD